MNGPALYVSRLTRVKRLTRILHEEYSLLARACGSSIADDRYRLSAYLRVVHHGFHCYFFHVSKKSLCFVKLKGLPWPPYSCCTRSQPLLPFQASLTSSSLVVKCSLLMVVEAMAPTNRWRCYFSAVSTVWHFS